MTGQAAQFQQLTRRALAANIMTLFSGSAISQGLTALTLLMVARQVGPDQYGQYVGTVVLVTFLSMFFSLGMDVWLLREGGSQPHRLGETAGSLLGLKFGLGIIWLAALALAARQLAHIYNPQILGLAALTVWLDSLLGTFRAIFKSALLNRLTWGLMVVSDLAWMLATLALYYNGEQELLPYMLVRIIVLALSVLIAGFVFWARFSPRIQQPILLKIRREFMPYAISDVLITSLLRADVLILSLTLGKTAVGYYSPAVSLINAIYVIPNSVNGVMLPVLSNFFGATPKRGWRMAGGVVAVHTALGLFLNAALFVVAPLLIGFLGPKYANSLEVLRILSFNLAFHGISFAMVAILVANNQQLKRTVLQAVVVAINVSLNLLIVQTYGINGVALVYVFTEMVMALGYTILVLNYRKSTRSGEALTVEA